MVEARNEHPDSFYKSFRPLLVFAQVCGLLPIKGILGVHHKQIRFSWTDPRLIYVTAVFGATCFYDYVYTAQNIKTGFRIDNYASTMFYSVCAMNGVFFMNLAKQFPEICRGFANLEKVMGEYPRSLALRIKIFFFLFLILSITEHGTMTALNISAAVINSANSTTGFWHEFYFIQFPMVAREIPFSGFSLILVFWVNLVCTFNWNFLDFFLIGISMEISSRVTIINNRLSNLHDNNDTVDFWRKISIDYNQISVLTRKLDKTCSKIIITSYISNLYHLSLQLLRSIRVQGTLYQKIYFYFSLLYLIMRMLTVSLTAANIHDESKKPMDKLYSIKYPCCNATRFLHQVVSDDVALTGNRFFTINRRFVLTIFGTLITYEVMLLQFNSLQYTD